MTRGPTTFQLNGGAPVLTVPAGHVPGRSFPREPLWSWVKLALAAQEWNRARRERGRIVIVEDL